MKADISAAAVAPRPPNRRSIHRAENAASSARAGPAHRAPGAVAPSSYARDNRSLEGGGSEISSAARSDIIAASIDLSRPRQSSALNDHHK